ncbi:MAG: organic radical-activating protein [SAR324 cluster bacterium]|uniref:7-carboxy-7-deazaguanine synthase n=1 Tax=SAR324 cluster bacterium TaxID=2024889 RepID=A0A2A4TAQ1_9DELT|nr:MAG: organic radical-activating protein [SAR324 cluster bacterium]
MKVSEIFYSLQGEGRHAGRAAIFVRFYDCNLACSFCDEPLHKSYYQEMEEAEVFQQIAQHPAKFVVITGGEPTLNDLRPFIAKLQDQGYYVAVETNGYQPTHIANADWVTYSPKNWKHIDFSSFFNEMKLIVHQKTDVEKLEEISRQLETPIFVQPQADQDRVVEENVQFCVNLIKKNPRFTLSLQLHKLLHIP